MNIITQYKWPVIVAAGLHGALFLAGPHTPFVREPGAIVDKTPLPPIPPIETALQDPPEPSALAAAGGPVEPMPDMPEPPPPMDLTDLFRIVPREPSTQIRDVSRLPDPGKISFVPGDGGPGPGGPIGVMRPIDLDHVPRTIAQPSPDYPYALKHDGVDGSVTVEFVVGMDGHVISAEAVKWTRREFVDAAVKAVLRWRFEPGTINGRKVRFRMAVPIEFNAAG